MLWSWRRVYPLSDLHNIGPWGARVPSVVSFAWRFLAIWGLASQQVPVWRLERCSPEKDYRPACKRTTARVHRGGIRSAKGPPGLVFHARRWSGERERSMQPRPCQLTDPWEALALVRLRATHMKETQASQRPKKVTPPGVWAARGKWTTGQCRCRCSLRCSCCGRRPIVVDGWLAVGLQKNLE